MKESMLRLVVFWATVLRLRPAVGDSGGYIGQAGFAGVPGAVGVANHA